MNNERILSKIRKLLAKAGDSNSPEEAAIAASMAEKMMRKHQIKHAQIIIDESEISGLADTHLVMPTATTPAWVGMLAVGVALVTDVAITKTRNGRVRIVGLHVDVQVAQSMMEYLIGETNRLAARFSGSRGEKGSFRRGCASEIQRRLEAMSAERREDMQRTSTGQELVIRKQDMIREYLGHIPTATSNRRREHGSYYAGREAGANVSLAPQVGNNAVA